MPTAYLGKCNFSRSCTWSHLATDMFLCFLHVTAFTTLTPCWNFLGWSAIIMTIATTIIIIRIIAPLQHTLSQCNSTSMRSSISSCSVHCQAIARMSTLITMCFHLLVYRICIIIFTSSLLARIISLMSLLLVAFLTRPRFRSTFALLCKIGPFTCMGIAVFSDTWTCNDETTPHDRINQYKNTLA